MYAHLITLKQIDQNRLSFPQVIDPDVRVNKDSHARCRLRGAASAAGSLPPSAASWRPLSIRTRSSTASLIKADRSLTPVSSSARASRSSSSVTVVLMLTSTLSIAPQPSSVDSNFDAASSPPSLHNSKAGPRPRATRPRYRAAPPPEPALRSSRPRASSHFRDAASTKDTRVIISPAFPFVIIFSFIWATSWSMTEPQLYVG